MFLNMNEWRISKWFWPLNDSYTHPPCRWLFSWIPYYRDLSSCFTNSYCQTQLLSVCVCVHVWVCLCMSMCVFVYMHAWMCVCVCVWRPTHNGLYWCNDGERERFPFLPTSWWLCMEVPGGRQFIMSPSPGLSLGEQAGTCVHELPPLPPSAGSQCVKPTSRGEKWLCYSISASYQ
jgi:hypothetical protein